MRQEYERFLEREAEVVAVGPEDEHTFRNYWERGKMPFVGLPDTEHKVAGLYGQEVRLLRGGRLPALLLIDKQGVVRYRHYGHSMRDIPPNDDVLALLDDLNREEKAEKGGGN